MDPLLQALQQSEIALYLRTSRWGYAAVNTAHVFGVALLVGAMVPLDLRLLGVWHRIPHPTLVTVLAPVAAVGLCLAAASGALLFSVRAEEYAAIGVLRLKLVLIILGVLSALLLHLRHGLALRTASTARLATAGAISMTCWIGALILGRTIAFAAG